MARLYYDASSIARKIATWLASAACHKSLIRQAAHLFLTLLITTQSMEPRIMSKSSTRLAVQCRLLAASILGVAAWVPAQAGPFVFNPGDIVVTVEGDGSNTGSYTDNQAAPLTLFQYAVSGTSSASAAGSLQLPQTTSGKQFAISGEYGSSSEGTLELSGNGQYLTLMGYGINANTFNANPGAYSLDTTNTALAQSGSVTGQSYTPVARVVALISGNGSVDTSTALTGVFNGNNPRSAATINGSTFYISGQGQSGDTTEGVFVAQRGATSATAINTTYDTRNVQIVNNQLFVSQDSKVGTGQLAFIASVGAAGSLPTGATTPAILPGLSTGSKKSADPGSLTLSGGNGNAINGSSGAIFISPEDYFFANSTTLYVADSGDPKAGGLGDGGLQKWTLNQTTNKWVLDYTLSTGLDLVADSQTSGTSGLYGLAGKVVGNSVELYATNFTLADLDPTFLYGITDTLSDTTATQAAGESFTQLEAAPADADFKGVAFAPTPVPLPSSAWMLLAGIGLLGFGKTRRPV
jgi:hypothetical protein